MATYSFNQVIDHSSDATFRAWGSAINNALTTVGLTQTADTGQVNWTTVTRPGTNTTAGYEIWRFNDSLQATAPIFIKLSYGTATSALFPRLLCDIGTGSDGAGTLTNSTLTTPVAANYAGVAASIVSTVTSYPSYCCYNTTYGVLTFEGWVGSNTSNNYNRFFFQVGRTHNADGTPNGKGRYKVGSGTTYNANNNTCSVITDGDVVWNNYDRYTSGLGGFLWLPGVIAASAAGTTPQLYNGWCPTPATYPMLGLAAAYNAEVSIGGTYDCALVGSTPCTYMCAAGSGGLVLSGFGSSTYNEKHLYLYQ